MNTETRTQGEQKMGLFQAFVSQTRKPEGFLGKMMVSGMNSGHAKLADWGFTRLPAITPERAVDHGACEEIGD